MTTAVWCTVSRSIRCSTSGPRIGAARHASLQMTASRPAVAPTGEVVVEGAERVLLVSVVVVASVVVVIAGSVAVVEAAVVVVVVVGSIAVGVAVVDSTVDAGAAGVEGTEVDVVDELRPSAAADEGTPSSARNQANPPAAPAPTNTPSIARNLRRLSIVSLTAGDGSSEAPRSRSLHAE